MIYTWAVVLIFLVIIVLGVLSFLQVLINLGNLWGILNRTFYAEVDHSHFTVHVILFLFSSAVIAHPVSTKSTSGPGTVL